MTFDVFRSTSSSSKVAPLKLQRLLLQKLQRKMSKLPKNSLKAVTPCCGHSWHPSYCYE